MDMSNLSESTRQGASSVAAATQLTIGKLTAASRKRDSS
jgi:hypothetical protein